MTSEEDRAKAERSRIVAVATIDIIDESNIYFFEPAFGPRLLVAR
jgi:hypothetical protein